MTREEAIQEIGSNIKAYVVEVAMSDGLHVHVTNKCNIDCPYFFESGHIYNYCACRLFNATLTLANERLLQCLAIKPEYEYIAKKLEKTK